MVGGGAAGEIAHGQCDWLAAPTVPCPGHAVGVVVVDDTRHRRLSCCLPGVGQRQGGVDGVCISVEEDAVENGAPSAE